MPLTSGSGLQLTRFEISNIGHIDVSVSGNVSLDKIIYDNMEFFL